MVVVVVDGGWSKKRFSDFAQFFFRRSSGDIMFGNLENLRKTFFIGKKIQLQLSKIGGFLVEKKVL